MGLAALTQFTVTTRTPQLLVRPHSFRNRVAAHTVEPTPSVDGIPPFIPARIKNYRQIHRQPYPVASDSPR